MNKKWLVMNTLTGLALLIAGGLLYLKAAHDYAYVPARSVTVPRPYPKAGQAVDGLAFSPDGHTLVAADTQTGVSLWTVPQLEYRGRLGTTIGDSVLSMFWTGNGVILSGDDSLIRRWSVSKNSLKPLPSELPANQMLGDKKNYEVYYSQRHMISPSGRLAAAADASGNFAAWDVQTGRRLFRVAAPPAGPNSYAVNVCNMVFSADERSLAITSLPGDNTVGVAPLVIVLRDARTGAIRKTWQWKTDDMMRKGIESGGNLADGGLMFSPDGTLLATADDSQVALWDTQTGQLKRVLEVGSSNGWGGDKRLAYFAHGQLLAGVGWGSAAPVWNVATGNLVQTFHGEGLDIEALAISPDDRWLATGEQGINADGKIKLWDVSRLAH